MLARVTLRSRHLTCQNLDIPKRRGQAMELCTCIRQLLLMNCIAPLEVVLIITLLNANGISGSLVTLSQVSPRCIVWFQKISIPPPRKGLEFPGGWGVQRPRKILRGGGVLYQFILFFPDRFHYSYMLNFLFAFCLPIHGHKH